MATWIGVLVVKVGRHGPGTSFVKQQVRRLQCSPWRTKHLSLICLEYIPKKEVKIENNDHVNLKVAGQDCSVAQFKSKKHTPLSKLMKAYWEGQDTPAQLEMEDEDTIDVFQQQRGGVY
ncbi:small ubiquitin-related modifier 2-like [Phyllostomus hastatus]|uniref:small ubiquitin-related modifier 2-like n=1 Tax=Phyllostomus hastatus TaxID=9423 RepID=UPI001E684FF2|nr:small ubiquitin-related modifier 2-like [Phyllostomus hastatus]